MRLRPPPPIPPPPRPLPRLLLKRQRLSKITAAVEGEASEEPTGEPVAELFPADGYSKDLEGYKQYAIDALRSDEHAPADIIETSVASIEAVTDGNDSSFEMMVNQGRILSYADFIG